jgi:membrane protein YdbS with pleckstrin-like domain
MIKDMFDPGENLVWEGKPDRMAYIIGRPLYYLMILAALAFYLFTSYTVSSLENSSVSFMSELGFGLAVAVFVFVIMPVYRAINWKFIHYAITDKRVYFTSGIIGRDINVLDYTAISSPDVNVGLIDKLRNCGTIRLNPRAGSGNIKVPAARASLEYIPDVYNVYKMIKQMALDIKSDIYYPNALRPEENEGYNTKYIPKNNGNKAQK